MSKPKLKRLYLYRVTQPDHKDTWDVPVGMVIRAESSGEAIVMATKDRGHFAWQVVKIGNAVACAIDGIPDGPAILLQDFKAG